VLTVDDLRVTRDADDEDTCVRCGGQAHCVDYDSDEDLYRMICDEEDCRHVFTFSDEFETWK
jgi:hypothetical protein